MTAERSLGTRCNIGPAEVARRRRSAILVTGLTIVVAVALVGTGLPPAARLAIFPFATAAGITWAQVFHRFCVAFGALGIQNFGRLGESERVDPGQRAEDRRRVAQLVLEGAAMGVTVTLILVVPAV